MVTKTQGAELAIKCRGKTPTEVREGRITDPVDLTDLPRATTSLTPRYALGEQHGEQNKKIRLIGDFCASAVNAIIETDDTNVPESLDSFISIASISN